MLEDEVSAYNHDEREDFLPELLPFSDHPNYKSASSDMKSKVLSWSFDKI